jgi:hypothetical protein
MPRPESTDMAAGGQTLRDGKPVAITIAQLAAEYLPTIKPQPGTRVGKAFYSLMSKALNVLARMPEVGSSADLVLNEAFVERFLDTWGGSTRHDTIGAMLRCLGKLRDWTAERGYLSPSEIGQPVPIPPSWDEWDEQFAQSGRVLTKHHTRRSDPDPTWEEVVRLVTHLKDRSRQWLDGRLLALVSLVMLARLQPYSEAGTLRHSDVDWEGQDRMIRIAAREQIKLRRAMARIPLGGHLTEILDRWSRRSGPEYVLPSQGLRSFWNISDNFGVGSGNDLLGKACQEAGIRVLTLRSLKRFGESHRERLAGEDSPFRLGLGDGVLQAEDISMARLRDEVTALYGPTPKRSLGRFLGRLNTVFDLIAALPGGATSFSLASGDFIEKLAASVGISDPYSKTHNYIIIYIHNIINKSIFLGFTESSPFAGRPGFYVQMNGRPRLRRERVTEPTLSPASPPARVEASRRCPVELRGEGLPILVYGKVLPQMTGIAYEILQKLVDAFRQGRACLARELSGMSESGRLRPFARAVDRPGFEPLRRVIPDYKGGRNRTIEIVDIGPEI